MVSHPRLHLLLSGFLLFFFLAILIEIQCFFIVVSLDTSLLANDVECLFKCVFIVHISSLVNRMLGFDPFVLLTLEFCFGCTSLVRQVVCKRLLPFCGWSSHSLSSVQGRAEVSRWNQWLVFSYGSGFQMRLGRAGGCGGPQISVTYLRMFYSEISSCVVSCEVHGFM